MLSLLALMHRFSTSLADVMRNPETRALPGLVLALLLSGTIFYWQAEDWSLLDSLYFSVTTLTTVGMGDLAPTSDGSKVFTVLYIMVGIGVLVAFVTALAEQMLRREREKHDSS
jgi:hypothetical protein